MDVNRNKDFEARLFLKLTGFRKEDHAPRLPAKQRLLDEMYVERARGCGLLRISDNEYVCRKVFQERLTQGTLPDNKWVERSRVRFEKCADYPRQVDGGIH